MNVLVYKGWAGWGDRLQGLLGCIAYARERKRTLVVDWMDDLWGQPFEDTFQLVDVSWSTTLPTETESIYPAVWKTMPLTQPAGLWMNGETELLKVDLEKDYPQRVLVVCNVGFRRWNLRDWDRHIRIVDPSFNVAPLSEPYVVAHLRGTDRLRHPILDIQPRLTQVLNDLKPIVGRRPLYVISDDPNLTSQFARRYGGPYTLVSHPVRPRKRGTGQHMIPSDELEGLGKSKVELNRATLWEWWLMVNARSAVTTVPQSLYFQMARALGRSFLTA